MKFKVRVGQVFDMVEVEVESDAKASRKDRARPRALAVMLGALGGVIATGVLVAVCAGDIDDQQRDNIASNISVFVAAAVSGLIEGMKPK